jgi:hypothetical protein
MSWTGPTIYLHRGGKEGPLIASAHRALFGSNCLITFPDGKKVNVSRKLFRGFITKGRFEFGEGKYEWKGYHPLELKTEGGELIAQVNRRMFRGDQHLDVYKKGEGMIDMILTSLLLVLYAERTTRNS